jgi:hypothetical protein
MVSTTGETVAYLVYRGRDGEIVHAACLQVGDLPWGAEVEELTAGEYADVRTYEIEQNDADPTELDCRKCGRQVLA